LVIGRSVADVIVSGWKIEPIAPGFSGLGKTQILLHKEGRNARIKII